MCWIQHYVEDQNMWGKLIVLITGSHSVENKTIVQCELTLNGREQTCIGQDILIETGSDGFLSGRSMKMLQMEVNLLHSARKTKLELGCLYVCWQQNINRYYSSSNIGNPRNSLYHSIRSEYQILHVMIFWCRLVAD